jgi:hypothetical protein
MRWGSDGKIKVSTYFSKQKILVFSEGNSENRDALSDID